MGYSLSEETAMDERSSQHLLQALGFGFTHLIDTKPVSSDDPGQQCHAIYLYESPGAEDLSIFGLTYASGTDDFGDESWCNAAYDAMDELAIARPAGTPLAYMLCTPMSRTEPAGPRGFWYGIGMELVHGMKITIVQEATGPFTVKPVQQGAMEGMLDQLSEALA
jgi:hypothetical protein